MPFRCGRWMVLAWLGALAACGSSGPGGSGGTGGIAGTGGEAGTGGVAGTGGIAGTGGNGAPCDGVRCPDTGNDCTVGICDTQTGQCEEANEPAGTSCDGDNGQCDVAGTCVDNCDGVDCSDGNQCTDDICDPTGGSATCSNPPDDTNSCTTCPSVGGGVCQCSGGVCVDGLLCPPPPAFGQVPAACRNSFNQAVSTVLIDMGVFLDDCVFAGSPFNATIEPTLNLDTAFLQAAADALCILGFTLTQADLNAVQVRADALTGATCTSQLSVLSPVPQTVVFDATVTGVCGAGGNVVVHSGVSVPLPQVFLPCTHVAGTVSFCATGTVPSNVLEANPPIDTYVTMFVSPFAVNFACGEGASSPGNVGDATDTVDPIDPVTDCVTFLDPFSCTATRGCNDFNDCTLPQTCNTATGLCEPDPPLLEPAGTSCDGGNGTCDDAGTCVDHCDGVDCDDGKQCTFDRCDSVAGGICSNSPLSSGAFCDFDTGGLGVCDGAGECVETECSLTGCNDSNDCTSDFCDIMGGVVCRNPPRVSGTSCDGGNGTCDGAGNCVTGCIVAGCDDGTICTNDSCNDATCDGTAANCCVNTPANEGADCSAENPPLASCQGGVCAADSCTNDADCDDGNECTTIFPGACNSSTGICARSAPVAAGTPCAGNTGQCDGAGTCVDNCTSDADCEDTNVCTAAPPGACQPDGSCLPSIPANEGGACTGASGAGSGLCVGGTCVVDCTTVVCDDGNVCTVAPPGACQPDGSCLPSVPANEGGVCDAGGGAGTGSCTSGICVDNCAGVVCNDGNPCTDDPACDSAAGGVCPPPVNDDSNSCESCVNTAPMCVCVAGFCENFEPCPPLPINGQALTVCRNSFNQALSVFAVDMVIDFLDCTFANSPFTVGVTPTLNFDQNFLQIAVDTLCSLGVLLTEADITVAQVQLDALTGATCTPTLAGPIAGLFPLDITVVGTCPGATLTVNAPLPLLLPIVNVPCTAGPAPGPVGMCAVGTTPANAVAGAVAVDTWAAVNIGFPTDVSFQCGDGVSSLQNPCTSDADCTAVGNEGTVSTCDLGIGFCTPVPLDLDPTTQCATFPVIL